MNERVAEELKDRLEDMDSEDIVSIYNEYAVNNRYEIIYRMDEFNDYFRDKTPLELVEMGKESDVDPDDLFFCVDEPWDEPHSFSEYDEGESPIDLEDLVDYIIDNDMCVAGYDFSDIVEEEEDEDE